MFKHALALLTLSLLAVSAFAGVDITALPGQIQDGASFVSDVIALAQNHPVMATVSGVWAAHTEASPFVKKWKHSGSLDLLWQIGRAVLGVLTKRRQ